MKSKNDEAVEFGQTMWMMLANTFIDTLDGNGMTESDARTLAWAGFMSAATGTMCADIGMSAAGHVQDSVKRGASAVGRAQLKAVPEAGK